MWRPVSTTHTHTHSHAPIRCLPPASVSHACFSCVLLRCGLLCADGMLVRDLCTTLSTVNPSALHVLLCSPTGSVAIAAGFPLAPIPLAAAPTPAAAASVTATPITVSAKSILARLQSSLLQQGAQNAGKGGGSNQIVLGVLPTQYAATTQEPLVQRVVRALNAVDEAAGKLKAK